MSSNARAYINKDGAMHSPNDNPCGFGRGALFLRAAVIDNLLDNALSRVKGGTKGATLATEYPGCPRPAGHPGEHHKWWPYSRESAFTDEDVVGVNRLVEMSAVSALQFWRYVVVQMNGNWNLITQAAEAAVEAALDMDTYLSIQKHHTFLSAMYPWSEAEGANADYIVMNSAGKFEITPAAHVYSAAEESVKLTPAST